MSTQIQDQANHTNRLINETSTYLLQHAHNPVDWYPWGDEALDRAKKEDRPVLLSVGYAACHWCHVMEHESFEDDDTAKIMNDLFVCIKVDREERPDIDEIYMKAVQMMTGHGGWPMTVFLTPDLKPFFAGTYFPPQEKHGMPSFKRVLASVNTAWKEQRDTVENSATEITSHLSLFEKVPDTSIELQPSIIENSLNTLWRSFDRDYGGLGGAPKFPHCGSITLEIMHCASAEGAKSDRSNHCQEMVTKTLDCMADGGIYDQLGGGFARYSVDRLWLIPHFEKMLYDNAQLCRNYLQGFQLTGREYWARIARQTLEFVLREMTTSEGSFYSSLDADSEAVEGKYYSWTPDEILKILGSTEGDWICKIYGVDQKGNFEHGTSVLHLTKPPEELAKANKMTLEQFWDKLDSLGKKLLAEREKRVRPGRDEKVLVSWNSLMISAFVDGYRALGDRKYLAVAHRAADFILANMVRNKRLLRTWGKGQAKLHGYLDDYAYFTQALLDIAAVDFDSKWVEQAMALATTTLELFSDPTDGSLYYTSSEHERLLARTKTFYDTSTPSPSAVASLNLLRLAKIFDRKDFSDRAEKILRLYAPYFQKLPDQFSSFLLSLEAFLTPSTEIVFVADADGDDWERMLLSIHSSLIPNALVVLKDASSDPTDWQSKSPLLKDRDLVKGEPAVYICRNYTCQAPITELAALEEAIGKLSLKYPIS